METFRSISITACFLSIVITIFNTLYPSEKFNKQIKIIFSLIFLLCIIKPITDGNIHLPNIKQTVSVSTDYYTTLSENADEYFVRSVESNISTILEEKLHEENIYPEHIKTSINISENNSISINEVKIVLNELSYSEKVIQCIIDNTTADTKVIVKKKEGNQTNANK